MSNTVQGAATAGPVSIAVESLRHVYKGGAVALDGVDLEFSTGLFGLLGPNGAGKSTLMKIMAGIDKDFTGEAWAAEGAKVGYLPQEPQLDPGLDVRGNIELGLAHVKRMLEDYDAVSARFGEVDEHPAGGELLSCSHSPPQLGHRLDQVEYLEHFVVVPHDIIEVIPEVEGFAE